MAEAAASAADAPLAEPSPAQSIAADDSASEPPRAALMEVTFTEHAPLGVVLRSDMVIMETVAGSASEKLGVRAGDLLLRVGSSPCSGIGAGQLADVLAALKASPRPVTLTFERPAPSASAPLAAATGRSAPAVSAAARAAVASAGTVMRSLLSSSVQAIQAVDGAVNKAIGKAIDSSTKVCIRDACAA